MHLIFEDGTVADVFASELVLAEFTIGWKYLPTIIARAAISAPSMRSKPTTLRKSCSRMYMWWKRDKQGWSHRRGRRLAEWICARVQDFVDSIVHHVLRLLVPIWPRPTACLQRLLVSGAAGTEVELPGRTVLVTIFVHILHTRRHMLAFVVNELPSSLFSRPREGPCRESSRHATCSSLSRPQVTLACTGCNGLALPVKEAIECRAVREDSPLSAADCYAIILIMLP